MDLPLSWKSIVPTTAFLTARSAVARSGIARFQVFQLTAWNGDGPRFTSPRVYFTFITKPDALADESGVRLNRRDGFKEAETRSAVF